ncbi:MAG: TerC family protein [Chloroherpetonaceae bacterium]|nr:TerC family protein [Chloroherpetonaceae bacterium]MDW8436617.1 TerC family protein [Chloroherpetonaceae bacterium]
MFDLLIQPENLANLLSLTVLEIVLGIDNVIFISILVSKLPTDEQPRARNASLVAALALRLGLLGAIGWILSFEAPLFAIFQNEISGKDLMMLLGGVFLMYKAVAEIHAKIEGVAEGGGAKAASTFATVMLQSVALSFIFSIDSIVTAIGLSKEILVMALAIVASSIVMMLFAKPIGDFIREHPTTKMLGLALLLLIGVLLVAEAFDVHVPKGYMYFAIAFALFVEVLNIKMKKKASLLDRTIQEAAKTTANR